MDVNNICLHTIFPSNSFLFVMYQDTQEVLCSYSRMSAEPSQDPQAPVPLGSFDIPKLGILFGLEQGYPHFFSMQVTFQMTELRRSTCYKFAKDTFLHKYIENSLHEPCMLVYLA